VVFTSVVCLIWLYFCFPRKVAIDFVGSYPIEPMKTQIREMIFSEKEDLMHVCRDSSNLLFHSEILENVEQFEFDKFDYLFVIGKEAKEVKYSPYILHFIDMEPHYGGEPVLIEYIGDLHNRVFVYRLTKKPKYRHLCC
jgi:hypothetical protein